MAALPLSKANEDIVKLIARTRPSTRRWLEQKGYIAREGNGIQLTPAGYKYFIKIQQGNPA